MSVACPLELVSVILTLGLPPLVPRLKLPSENWLQANVGVTVGVRVTVGVFVIVGVAVLVGVFVTVGVSVGVNVTVGVFVGVRVGVSVTVGVGELVNVGVKVGVSVSGTAVPRPCPTEAIDREVRKVSTTPSR